MTRKDYVLIAKVLKYHMTANNDLLKDNIITEDEADQVSERLTDLTESFAYELQITNVAFDAQRFLSACTPDYLKSK